MLTSAEINIHNRPRIDSFDNVNRPISFLIIPTLENLKYALFEQMDHAHEVGYPLKVTTIEDIESTAFLARRPPNTLGHHDTIPTVVSRMTEIVTEEIHSFTEEAITLGGTVRIFDADGLTQLSQDHLFKKYYPV